MRLPRFALLFAILSLCVLLGSARLAQQPSAQAAANNFGLIFYNVTSSAQVSNALSKLGMTSWFTFGDSTGANPSGYSKALLIRTNVAPLSQATLQSMADSANPGAYWIIGNEPNVPGQDWISGSDLNANASAYAAKYNYYSTTIRAIDPTAKLVAGNVLNWNHTCLNCLGFRAGIDWVNAFLQEYQTQFGTPPPVDVWGIHAYIIDWRTLPMVNWQLATEDIAALRLYLDNPNPAGNSQTGKPIWVTEFGVIWGYDGYQSAGNDQCADHANCITPIGSYRQDLITDYLQNMVGWLNANAQSKNIQKWFLYTNFALAESYASQYGGIHTMDGSGAAANLSPSGEVYRDLGGGAAPTPTPTTPAGGGDGGGGGNLPSATPVATAIPTPTPAPTPAPAPVSTTAPMDAAGGQIDLRGGSSADGGISVIFPADALGASTTFAVTVSDALPSDVRSPSGAVFLYKTIEITPATTTTLKQSAGIRINLSAADLAGRSIQDIRGGVVLNGRVEPRPTRVVDADQGILWVDVDHFTKFTLFAVTTAGPLLSSPEEGASLPTLGANLSWATPPTATQYEIQVIPFNNDGPGIDLVRNIESSYLLNAPDFGAQDPNYVMLPGMTYVWRVRTTTASRPPSELTEDDWSAWSLRSFKTPAKSSNTIFLAIPNDGATLSTLTPSLTWGNSDKETFYYEVQVSKDPAFGPNAFLYWELIHAGVATLRNTYTIPDQYPLELDTPYYWRVRPRIQGDGKPVDWTPAHSFAVH